jgi:hypothetical protein
MKTFIALALLVLTATPAAVLAQAKTSAAMTKSGGGSASVETAKTPIGDIKLQFGLPATPAEERRIYDQMDFQRATQAYIWALPFVSLAGWENGQLHEIGAAMNETVLYIDFKDKLGILTANLTTPYLAGFGNVASGPVVVEVPAGNTAGMVLDLWQRPMTDLGQAGPDKGVASISW